MYAILTWGCDVKLFVDTADVAEIRDLVDCGFISGVTTNPSLIMKSGRSNAEVIAEICSLVAGQPVSAEVTSTSREDMFAEGRELAAIASNVVVKLPMTLDGLAVCRRLADLGIRVNVTLAFSVAQILLAANAGAAFVSPFVGRLDDLGEDGVALIQDARLALGNLASDAAENAAQILAASIRSPLHAVQVAIAGADYATIPPKVLRAMILHPLTDRGLEAFLADYRKSREHSG